MSDPTHERIVRALLRRHGRTFAQEARIPVHLNTPAPLFQLLCMAALLGTRVGADVAVRAARALASQGWTTAERVAATSLEERAGVLHRAGYARYDESTARMLGDTTALLVRRYGGDLRRLREAAGGDPDREHALLRELKGLGDAGAETFSREAQVAWEELYPYADAPVLEGARALDLPEDAHGLAALVGREDYPRLAAALVRTVLAGDQAEVRKQAGHSA